MSSLSANLRGLSRLIDRLEEFLEEYKTDMDADEVVTVEDTISVIDRLKLEIENQIDAEEDEDGDSDSE